MQWKQVEFRNRPTLCDQLIFNNGVKVIQLGNNNSAGKHSTNVKQLDIQCQKINLDLYLTMHYRPTNLVLITIKLLEGNTKENLCQSFLGQVS